MLINKKPLLVVVAIASMAPVLFLSIPVVSKKIYRNKNDKKGSFTASILPHFTMLQKIRVLNGELKGV